MKTLFQKACKKLSINPQAINANFHFVTADEIRELNKTYRGKDIPTDVLSFPMLELVKGEIPNPSDFPLDVNPNSNKIELGDIIICEQVAREKGLEIDYLYVHGLLHLFGWTHDTKKDLHAMHEMICKILEKD